MLEAITSEHTVWNVEHMNGDEIVLQEPIHKHYLSINHHGQLHLVATRDHTCHLQVVLEDVGEMHHGVRHQAFHNKERFYLCVPKGETGRLHARQLKQGEPPCESEWFQVDIVHPRKDVHHHQHVHHEKDHQ